MLFASVDRAILYRCHILREIAWGPGGAIILDGYCLADLKSLFRTS
jgi:hypothetical protein